ncbi:MAG TPA: hypothetical protein VKR83_09090 [Ktedonobacteraceae bacterium]|nr:hypothetical protein [Ktedonobacteraceae bacterium]
MESASRRRTRTAGEALASRSLRGPDEVQFAFHPTLTRLWSLKGRRGQRFIEAPGDNRKAYGFGLVDWRDG